MPHAFGDMVSVEWGMPGEEISLDLCDHHETACGCGFPTTTYLSLDRAKRLHAELGAAIAYAEKHGAKKP